MPEVFAVISRAQVPPTYIAEGYKIRGAVHLSTRGSFIPVIPVVCNTIFSLCTWIFLNVLFAISVVGGLMDFLIAELLFLVQFC